MSINAGNLIREIRDRNDGITKNMPFEKRLDFIRKKAREIRSRVKKIVGESVKG